MVRPHKESSMTAPTSAPAAEAIAGVSHWVTKQHESGPILLVHGSSMASTPTFDLQVPGHGETHSPMDYFARLGYDVWCFDCEGYGRSDKTRDSKFYVADGADDTEAVAEYIRQ